MRTDTRTTHTVCAPPRITRLARWANRQHRASMRLCAYAPVRLCAVHTRTRWRVCTAGNTPFLQAASAATTSDLATGVTAASQRAGNEYNKLGQVS